MPEAHPLLRENVRLLGGLLGDTIRAHLGDAVFAKVEAIRGAAKEGRASGSGENPALLAALAALEENELVPVARAFNQFLNLANIAEQYHRIRRRDRPAAIDPAQGILPGFLREALGSGVAPEQLARLANELRIEMVLTAHPTEIARRTQIQKYDRVAALLAELDYDGLHPAERDRILERLRRTVAGAWHTNDIRTERPTPVEEARWGFAVIENSLWRAVPEFLRGFDRELRRQTGQGLDPRAVPVRFAAWMGGDRDGNPNVTARVTAEVLREARWMAADLYLRDLATLIPELSMHEATPAFRARVGDVPEPYRAELRVLRQRLRVTRAAHDGAGADEADPGVIRTAEELWEPLHACYESLHQSGLGEIADGNLLSTLRRVACFGICLTRLDIRQDAARHTQALDEITVALGLGSYAGWDEAQRQAFLLQELAGSRPLLPRSFAPGADVAEVLDTCRVVAAQSQEVLGSYIISMAGQPSDVLAVILLLRECGIGFNLPVVPLFETLEDLDRAPASMRALLDVGWYREYVGGRQQVMIGYSDSAKGAGKLSATWAQYRAQEALVKLCHERGLELTLFHGRGGTVGRGGGPAQAAIFSQPPGSVNGSLRVTEQGEVIRHKFGLPAIACQSMEVYASAVMAATLMPPPEPRPEWRELMDAMSADAHRVYVGLVRDDPQFVPYFRQLTPEQELGRLPLGSRPAKRRPSGGVESLRAIPWVFAWTQTRLMLPAWLGCGEALRNALAGSQAPVLENMLSEWPFFRAFIDMLEMALSKSDPAITRFYERKLVDAGLQELGGRLRGRLDATRAVVLQLLGQQDFLESNADLRQSIDLRNPYIDPLHYLQAELLYRERGSGEAGQRDTDQALMLTMAGIAAGLRNTG